MPWQTAHTSVNIEKLPCIRFKAKIVSAASVSGEEVTTTNQLLVKNDSVVVTPRDTDRITGRLSRYMENRNTIETVLN